MSDFMTRKEIDRNRISLVWAKVEAECANYIADTRWLITAKQENPAAVRVGVTNRVELIRISG